MRINNGHVLGGVGFVLLPACVFSIPVAAPILCIAATAALIVMRQGERRWPTPPAALTFWFAILLIYGALSSLWAVEVRLSLLLAAQLLGLLVAGLVLLDGARGLAPAKRRVFENAFLAGFVIGLALLFSELTTWASMNVYLHDLAILKATFVKLPPLFEPGRFNYSYFDRTITLVGLLLWPALSIAQRRAGWMGALALAAFAAITVSFGHSATALVAFLVGGVVYLIARWRPRRAALTLGSLIALGIAIAPLALRSKMIGWAPALLGDSDKAQSLSHRLAIWDFAIDKIAQKPFFGWGLNSSRVIPGGHTHVFEGGEAMPLHPHDMALQAWLELGVPGVVLAIVLVLLICAAASRLKERPSDQAAALAVIAAAATNAVSGYDLWHPWWWSFLWLAGAIAAASLTPSSPHRS